MSAADEFRLLTAKGPGKNHRETLVTINWDNITEDQLKTMGRAYIIHVLQSHWRKDNAPIPEKINVQATSMIHAEVFIPKEYTPRKKKDQWDLMLENLTPEEQAVLLENLQG